MTLVYYSLVVLLWIDTVPYGKVLNVFDCRKLTLLFALHFLCENSSYILLYKKKTPKFNGLNQLFEFAQDFVGHELRDVLMGLFTSDPHGTNCSGWGGGSTPKMALL